MTLTLLAIIEKGEYGNRKDKLLLKRYKTLVSQLQLGVMSSNLTMKWRKNNLWLAQPAENFQSFRHRKLLTSKTHTNKNKLKRGKWQTGRPSQPVRSDTPNQRSQYSAKMEARYL